MQILNGFLLALLLSLPAYGEIYKWVDEQGKTHYSDSKPDHIQAESVTPKVNSYQHQAVPESVYGQQEIKLNLPKKIVMYATSWCGYCKKARRYFADNNIDYVERDIETSEQAKREYDKLQGKGVPVLRIGDTTMRGWSVSKFEKIYRP
ncbi:glutaredoxin family protein [Gilvimarinus agarilyticus]|uniref:glutaredoxin family protein n=1 Tax=unclassified Gilvimarinus TaxID=2642066 RepID=UPI001C08EBDB|nr:MULTISPECIES: glutaredoxin family protein [unclassified Gilvimarinus]MBU2886256.1 glutaredoxin family protein [Gilvimarinus agarilyticus]MDO6570944.1 glutaredoxin family protein [Gilvimarinus sp. 2_MG-2023]MDO6747769.1 glutaredoxin family protein [Gilvimarinus sp. 1_MG-2023]